MSEWVQLRFGLKLISMVCLLWCPIGGVKMSASGSVWSSIDTIYQFGDSFSDTGNLMRENRCGVGSMGATFPYCVGATFPYGESYFHYATGRASDGLLIVDFYAMALGLDFLNPYLEKDANFSSGVNFAVSGATALDHAYLESKHIDISASTNSTLSVQLDWFQKYLKSTCSSLTGCRSKLERSVIFMESIGGVDYLAILPKERSLEVAYEMVPYVVGAIIDVVKEMVIMGAPNVVVPTVFPLGCFPAALIMSNTTTPEMYDDLGCRVDFNKVIEHHNQQLHEAILELQLEYPNATLIFADYYFAMMSLLRNASSLGFEKSALLVTCCGFGENPYNFNTSYFCGTIGVQACSYPYKRVIWDGYHCTQHINMYLSNWMLKHTIIPQLNHASSF